MLLPGIEPGASLRKRDDDIKFAVETFHSTKVESGDLHPQRSHRSKRVTDYTTAAFSRLGI